MANVTITIDPPTLEKGKSDAKRQFRSLSQHIAFLIAQDTTRRSSAATDSAAKRATPRKRATRKEVA